MDGVLELLLQHLLAGIPGQLQQEETGVGLREEVVWRVVFIQHLDDEVSAPEVGNGPGQPGPAPDEAKEERALCVDCRLPGVSDEKRLSSSQAGGGGGETGRAGNDSGKVRLCAWNTVDA